MGMNVTARSAKGRVSTQSGDKTSATVLEQTKGRLSYLVQNKSTSPLTLTFDGVVSIVLKGCSVTGDGLGGVWLDDEYEGAVSASGVGINYSVIELI